jgi:CDP-glucose 4,6-dehydratase
LFEAIKKTNTVRAIVNVTSDKCYDNKEWHWGYREDEAMGGFDPYSCSKGCAELVTSSYRNSFFKSAGIHLGSGRAGNVVGGGDWAVDRLIPDCMRALLKHRPIVIRNPRAIRPWQHVLEPLSGYLLLAEQLYTEGWNFGPAERDTQPVDWIVRHITQQWGDGATWQLDGGTHPHEANYLKLDCSKAKALLGWEAKWNLATTLNHTVSWYQQSHLATPEAIQALTISQIKNYTESSL